MYYFFMRYLFDRVDFFTTLLIIEIKFDLYSQRQSHLNNYAII